MKHALYWLAVAIAVTTVAVVGGNLMLCLGDVRGERHPVCREIYDLTKGILQ